MSTRFLKTGIVEASGETVNENLFYNSDFHDTYQQTTGWDTTKNGTLLATYWGGYNPGVTNQSTAYHAHLTTFGGELVYVFIRESETWLGVTQSSIQSRLAANTTYTFSVDQYLPTGSNNFLTAGLDFSTTESSTSSFGCGCPRILPATVDRDRWVRGFYTFTTPSNINLSATVRWYIYGCQTGTGTVYMRNPKLEVGTMATAPSLNNSEGFFDGTHGFVENIGAMSIYENKIQATEFIEY